MIESLQCGNNTNSLSANIGNINKKNQESEVYPAEVVFGQTLLNDRLRKGIKYPVEIVVHPTTDGSIHFEFLRDGIEVVSLKGFPDKSFPTSNPQQPYYIRLRMKGTEQAWIYQVERDIHPLFAIINHSWQSGKENRLREPNHQKIIPALQKRNVLQSHNPNSQKTVLQSYETHIFSKPPEFQAPTLQQKCPVISMTPDALINAEIDLFKNRSVFPVKTSAETTLQENSVTFKPMNSFTVLMKRKPDNKEKPENIVKKKMKEIDSEEEDSEEGNFEPVEEKTKSKSLFDFFSRKETAKDINPDSGGTLIKKNTFGPIVFNYDTSKSSSFSPSPVGPLKVSSPPMSKHINDLLSFPAAENVSDRERNGFRNLGQTCYINSTLQLLFNTNLFRKHMLTIQNITESSVLKELSDLFKAKDKEAVSDPILLKKCIGQKSARFASHSQEDAHEFLQELFSQLDINFQSFQSQNCVSDVFEWTLQNTIGCVQCSYESIKEDKCRDISVDFPILRQENLDLAALLHEHFKSEEVDYKCDKCPSMKATITHRIKSSPKVMILHLKRFAFDMPSMSYVKRKDHITLSKDLDLNPWCMSKADALSSEFQLRCIVNHLGSGHSKGHYVADVLDPAVQQWRTYDDAVMKRNAGDMTEKRGATCYLLAYINKDLI